MTDEHERAEGKNISLYPSDWQIVERVAKKSGIKSRSGAMRIILKEWLELKQMSTAQGHL